MCLTPECGAQAGTRVGAPGARKGRPQPRLCSQGLDTSTRSRRHAPGASRDLTSLSHASRTCATRERFPVRNGSRPPSPPHPPLQAPPPSSDRLSLGAPGRVPDQLRGLSVHCAALWWAGPERALSSVRLPPHRLTLLSRGPRLEGSLRHAGAGRAPRPTGTPARTQHQPVAYARGPPHRKTAADPPPPAHVRSCGRGSRLARSGAGRRAPPPIGPRS